MPKNDFTCNTGGKHEGLKSTLKLFNLDINCELSVVKNK